MESVVEEDDEEEKENFLHNVYCFSLLFFPFVKAMVNMKAQMYFIYLHSFNQMKATL